MPQVYKIVKKNSTAHKAVLSGNKYSNDDVLPVGGTHVLIPAIHRADYGHNVSHAQNRTKHRRLPNMQELRVSVGEKTVKVRLANSQLRTYKKLTAPQE